jgi:heterodisulfide reductase subunit B
MCQANLDMRQPRKEALPVLYFTELIALALGLPVASWLRRHFVDPRPLLRAKGLL